MGNAWVVVSVWVGLALIATLLAIWFKISTALTEIVGHVRFTNHSGLAGLRIPGDAATYRSMRYPFSGLALISRLAADSCVADHRRQRRNAPF